MRTLYHEFESLEHLLATRLLPGGEDQPIRFVVFGGTGAVGGASVMELCRLILMTRGGDRELSGEIYSTGLGDKEIADFVRRLYMALDDEIAIEKIQPLRHYRLDGRIDLHFDLLRLEIPADLADHVTARAVALGEAFSLEAVLYDYFRRRDCSFLRFVEGLEDRESLHAVLVAIPLPSVATYALGTIDDIVSRYGLDHRTGQRIKGRYLQTFVRGLAVIHQKYARRVVMAHTTAVGGMYRVDGGSAEIRLGFAHSARGKKLVDKKFFADDLTQVFLDQGFDVLVTAAAIGIDAVEFRYHLPSNHAVIGRLRRLLDEEQHETIEADDLDMGRILLYRFHDLPLLPPTRSSEEQPAVADDTVVEEIERPTVSNGDVEERADEQPVDREALRAEALAKHFPEPERRPWPRPLEFGAGKELIVDAAIRSGENGIFSVANCVALYHVMKVAIPEELAMVLVRHAVFGPERRRDWFHDKICYYSETENCLFALRLLDSYPELVRAHHGPFSLQAYQALGSSTHQARLHELGLLLLVLRLRELRRRFSEIPEDELGAALSDLDGFLWRRTRVPAFQDLEGLDASTLALEMCRLVRAEDMESAGMLLDFDPKSHGVRQPGREKFLHRLATHIQRYLQSITSLGIPIIYRDGGGEDRVLVGPYVAPLDDAIANSDGLTRRWRRGAGKWGTDLDSYRDWVICNSGFIDLRPHAIGTQAKEPDARLGTRVHRLNSRSELQAWLSSLPRDSYFTTCGLTALLLRLDLLGEKVCKRQVRLGTRETWKHLFKEDQEGRHLLSPGLVEMVRMYTEGLGKITGTEALWPRWGY
ncbi:MAG: hypothetical protein MPN21_06975 [Thermoanaerobaculia bacterium]|nr:hypothetical protein [Thermoanaerobaculia bacterium]